MQKFSLDLNIGDIVKIKYDPTQANRKIIGAYIDAKSVKYLCSDVKNSTYEYAEDLEVIEVAQ